MQNEDVIRRFYRSKKNFWNKYRFLADDWFLYYNGNQDSKRIALSIKNDFVIEEKNLFHLFLKGTENGS